MEYLDRMIILKRSQQEFGKELSRIIVSIHNSVDRKKM